MQGSILNEIYQVESQIIQRGSRTTYLAQNLDTNEPVVIKILKFGFDAQWSDFKLFEREAQTLKNINHPAIPNYLDYFELDLPDCKGFALVQEYIAAPSLEETVKAGRTFSESEIKEIAIALLNILIYLHQQHPAIIHRDIKPSNILLSDRSGNSVGQVYLIDFGAVKNVASSTEGGTITIVGTYGYMPPEQFGGHTTTASDLFSLGATLIYLATGRNPTELPSKDGKIAFAESVQFNYGLVRWLEQTIEPSCDCRFQSATAALQELISPLSTDTEASRILKQPKFSRLKLHKTPQAIEILVPPQGFVVELLFLIPFALFWNGFMLVWTGMATSGGTPFEAALAMSLFSIPFWLVGLGLIGSILFFLCGKTQLLINSQKISLTYECLGIKRQVPKAAVRRDIEAIEVSETTWQTASSGKKMRVASRVTIWANAKAYSIQATVKEPNNLSSTANRLDNYNPASIELEWLAQELGEWLRMPVTHGEA